MASHTTDWFPGRVTKPYRDNYDQVNWKTNTQAIEIYLKKTNQHISKRGDTHVRRSHTHPR